MRTTVTSGQIRDTEIIRADIKVNNDPNESMITKLMQVANTGILIKSSTIPNTVNPAAPGTGDVILEVDMNFLDARNDERYQRLLTFGNGLTKVDDLVTSGGTITSNVKYDITSPDQSVEYIYRTAKNKYFGFYPKEDGGSFDVKMSFNNWSSEGYFVANSGQSSTTSFISSGDGGKFSDIVLKTGATASDTFAQLRMQTSISGGKIVMNQNGIAISASSTPTTISSYKGIFISLNGAIRLDAYPHTLDNGATGKALYVDAAGNLKYGNITAPANSNFYIWNSTVQQASSNFNISGSGTIATSLTVPTIFGGTGSAALLNLSSTTHSTKGRILFGEGSAYDETNRRLGLNTLFPGATLDITQQTVAPVSAGIGTQSPIPFRIIAANGGSTSNGGAMAMAGNASDITIQLGNGGDVTGFPATGIAGKGGGFIITAGNGGTSSASNSMGGDGGTITFIAGSSGVGTTSNGAAGSIKIFGGNVTGGIPIPAGNVFLAGGNSNTGAHGNVILAVNDQLQSHGNVIIGSHTNSTFKLDVHGLTVLRDTLQVRGNITNATYGGITTNYIQSQSIQHSYFDGSLSIGTRTDSEYQFDVVGTSRVQSLKVNGQAIFNAQPLEQDFMIVDGRTVDMYFGNNQNTYVKFKPTGTGYTRMDFAGELMSGVGVQNTGHVFNFMDNDPGSTQISTALININTFGLNDMSAATGNRPLLAISDGHMSVPILKVFPTYNISIGDADEHYYKLFIRGNLATTSTITAFNSVISSSTNDDEIVGYSVFKDENDGFNFQRIPTGYANAPIHEIYSGARHMRIKINSSMHYFWQNGNISIGSNADNGNMFQVSGTMSIGSLAGEGNRMVTCDEFGNLFASQIPTGGGGGGGTYSFVNGLSDVVGTVRLGGSLNQNTALNGNYTHTFGFVNVSQFTMSISNNLASPNFASHLFLPHAIELNGTSDAGTYNIDFNSDTQAATFVYTNSSAVTAEIGINNDPTAVSETIYSKLHSSTYHHFSEISETGIKIGALVNSNFAGVQVLGTGSVKVTNNMGIGIETDSPSYPLHVRSPKVPVSATIKDILSVEMSSPVNANVTAGYGMGILFRNPETSGTIVKSQELGRIGAVYQYKDNVYKGALAFYVSDSTANNTLVERMRIAPNGYVGINTTNPQQQLSVLGDAYVSGRIKVGAGPGNIYANYNPLNIGTTTAVTYSKDSFKALYMDYLISDGNSQRAGTLVVNNINGVTTFSEVITNDLGNMSGVTISFETLSTSIYLKVSGITAPNFFFRYIAREL